MDAEPKRPLWPTERRRLAAVVMALVLLPAIYPGSMVPAAYGLGRGWVGEATFDTVYGPLIERMGDILHAARPGVGVATAVGSDGRVVTSRSRSEVSWWAPRAAGFVEGYWGFVGRCIEAGARHADAS